MPDIALEPDKTVQKVCVCAHVRGVCKRVNQTGWAINLLLLSPSPLDKGQVLPGSERGRGCTAHTGPHRRECEGHDGCLCRTDPQMGSGIYMY